MRADDLAEHGGGSGSSKSGSSGRSIFLKQTIEEFLDDLAAREPTPGGGSVAAVVIAMAAGLASMAARFSDGQLPDALRIAQNADVLREQAVSLAQEDARAYQKVLASFDETPATVDPETRRESIRSALSEAADVPLAITDIGAEVAQLCEEVARLGNGNLKGDATTGALLAHAGAQACTLLVEINLRDTPDERIEKAHGLAEVAANAARRALSGAGSAGPQNEGGGSAG